MKTLIIHPEDKTTDFLQPIYKTNQNKTVITGGVSKRKLDQQIVRCERIIMLGHGSHFGLFSAGQYPDSFGYIIDDVSAMYLRGKKVICIWCNADDYVYRNGLRGLYTGMFISEMDEAYQCGLVDVSQDMIDESNERFSWVIGKNINKSTSTIFNKLRRGYVELVHDNPVARYNYQRIYLR